MPINGPMPVQSTFEEKVGAHMDSDPGYLTPWWAAIQSAIVESPGIGTAGRFFGTDQGRRTVGPGKLESDEQVRARGDRPFSEEEYRASPYFRKNVPYTSDMTESRARDLSQWEDARTRRNFRMRNSPVSSFMGSFAGAAFDPINYIPFVGPAFRAWAIGRAGAVGGRALTGTIDSIANYTVTSMATREFRRRYGDDVSLSTMMIEGAVSAAFGAAFGGIVGGAAARRENALSRKIDDIKARAYQEEATIQRAQDSVKIMNDAIDSVVATGEVRLSPESVELLNKLKNSVDEAVPELEESVVTSIIADTHPDEAIRLDELVSIRNKLADDVTKAADIRSDPQRLADVRQELKDTRSDIKNVETEIAAREQAKKPVKRLTNRLDKLKAKEESLKIAANKNSFEAAKRKGKKAQAEIDKIEEEIGPVRESARAQLEAMRRNATKDLARENGSVGTRASESPTKQTDAEAAGVTPGRAQTTEEWAKEIGIDDDALSTVDDDVKLLEQQGRLTAEDKALIESADDEIKKADTEAEVMQIARSCKVNGGK